MTDKCPTCSKPVNRATENLFRPFCCDRCRLIDLGKWFAEDNRIPASEHEDNAPAPASDEDQPIH